MTNEAVPDLGKFVDWVWNLKAERDQLKAENEALRKDAERYRFTSRLLVDMGALPQSWGAMTYEKFDEMCDQAMADAAMTKEEPHG